LKKLQQYYIFKLSTSRLKKSNYSISLTLDDARKMGEVVSIGDSQMLRSLRQLKDQQIDSTTISQLFSEKRKIKRKKYSKENSAKLKELENQIDSILFVPEIVSIYVDDIRHYEYIGQNGFQVNGVQFKRLLCGAGQARRNSSIWIAEQFEQPLKQLLNNDRNEDIEIVPAKFNAYFSLASSATLLVSTPYFCVVPDLEISRTERVDYIEEINDEDDIVEERDVEINFNLWDGQGLISPKFAKQWADELELDYIPSTFIVRANFIKGMLCVFDFHKYAEDVVYEHFITDVWGNRYNIRDADIILTESQFKLWNAYDSIDDFIRKCKNNNLGWGVSRATPKRENNHTNLNYQFVQVLDLDNQQIEDLCQPTVDYFESITKNDIRYTLLYLLGELAQQSPKDNIFNSVHDNVTKALILNNKLLEDPYIKNYLIRGLNKKIKDSYIGNLIVEGQYTMIVADPYAFVEYIFNREIKGLLNRDEHYNCYWLDKGETRIAAMRAPLTWLTEVNLLNLKQNKEINEWYKYLNNCVVYNIFGNDNLIQGGSDFDGDIICLTNNKQVIEGTQLGLPIHYANKKAQKQRIIEEELYLADINGFNNRVGFVTNSATTAFAILPTLEVNSPEYIETINRLKRFRKEQGSTIDATKGLIIKPFPMHWTKWKKTPKKATEEEIKEIEFNNRIVINKRPYFMRWVYSTYNKKYLDYKKRYSKDSEMRFNKTLDELLAEYHSGIVVTEEESFYLDEYYRYNPLLETDCLMNKIAWYMEGKIKQLKLELLKKPTDENILILKNHSYYTDKKKYKKLYDLYKLYKSGKRNFAIFNDDENSGGINTSNKFKTIEQYNKFIRQKAEEISSDGIELANLAVDICYVTHATDSKNFVWQIFGNEIVENILQNKQEDCFVPFLNKKGDIKYLGEKYSMHSININVETYEDI
jgi:hypothetical protein